MTVTAFAMPGLNSLLNPRARTRFSEWPEVRSRVERVREVLRDERDRAGKFDSLESLSTKKLYDRDHVSLTAAWIVAIQVGVAERVRSAIGAPSWVIGCSLGDVARTVLAGCCSFEDALRIPLSSPQREAGIDRIGRNVAVLAPSSRHFDERDLRDLEACGIEACPLSPRMLNVSGRFEDLPGLEKLATERRWKLLPLLDYPVHSRYLERIVPRIARELEPLRFEDPGPGTRVYSTLLRREILSAEELRPELERNLVLTHHWHVSARRLVDHHGVRRFVNIGPCRTLSKLLAGLGFEVVEPEELI